jgi:hypothetical protein
MLSGITVQEIAFAVIQIYQEHIKLASDVPDSENMRYQFVN